MSTHRCVVLLAVGEPIRVEKAANPSQKDVDDLHQKYLWQLTDLFDKFNPIYGREGDTLHFI